MNASPSDLAADSDPLPDFSASRDFALDCDAADILAPYRKQFELPVGSTGQTLNYLCGHSLGLAPRAALDLVSEELADWAALGVGGHHTATRPWIDYAQNFTKGLQHLTGALASEVIAMNSLTVNLHLMMASFYRPVGMRDKVLIEAGAFSSDRHAILGQLSWHKLDVEHTLVELAPRPGEETLRIEDIESKISELGSELALVLWPGVQYRTGQAFDCARITRCAHGQGAIAGFDMAHAIGNLPLSLHDWDIDFAVWCSYKYLNAGPGAVAGAFVHERHATNTRLPRLAGWFGNDPNTRFRLHLEPEFIPVPSADGWQISNPPIFSMVPLRASLAIFDEAGGMESLRAKSIKLTGYLEFLLTEIGSKKFTVITPREPGARGCQLSILAHEHPKKLFEELQIAGVKCDFREPNVVRVAPTPLYNTFDEVWRFAKILAEHQ